MGIASGVVCGKSMGSEGTTNASSLFLFSRRCNSKEGALLWNQHIISLRGGWQVQLR